MDTLDAIFRQQVKDLVDAYREQCLWFLRMDYYPADAQEILRVLEYVRRYGDREAFSRAGELIQWLLPSSNEPSAVS